VTDLPPLADETDYAAFVGPVAVAGSMLGLLSAASARVRAFCGWSIFPSVSETFTLNGSGTYRQFLPTMYLTDVASVTDSGSLLDLTTLDWATEGWVEWSQAAWPFPYNYGSFPGIFSTKPRGVVVAVTHGYPVAPAEIVSLVCSMAARASASPGGVVREQALSQSVTYSQVAPGVTGGVTLLAHEMADLGTYRIPGLR
jgi:hypothetical protein